MKSRLFTLFSLALLSFTLLSCSDSNPSNPPVVNDHGVPTTVELILVKYRSDGTLSDDTTRALVRDTSVVQGRPASEGQLLLDDRSRFQGTVRIYDESGSSRVDLTADIEREKDGHLFVYTPKGGLDGTVLAISELDKDNKGQDLGLRFRVDTGDGPRAGLLNLRLRHYDSNNKNDAQFDTDIDRDFVVAIR